MSTLPLRALCLCVKRSPLSLRSCVLSTADPQLFFPVSPLQSALPKNAPITLLESALPKTRHLKSFRIRTYKKRRGEGVLLLSRNPSKDFCPERSTEARDLFALAPVATHVSSARLCELRVSALSFLLPSHQSQATRHPLRSTSRWAS